MPQCLRAAFLLPARLIDRLQEFVRGLSGGGPGGGKLVPVPVPVRTRRR
jgi:hypothetical protein